MAEIPKFIGFHKKRQSEEALRNAHTLSAARPLVGAAKGAPQNGNLNNNIANNDKMSGPGPKQARPGRIFGSLRKASKNEHFE